MINYPQRIFQINPSSRSSILVRNCMKDLILKNLSLLPSGPQTATHASRKNYLGVQQMIQGGGAYKTKSGKNSQAG